MTMIVWWFVDIFTGQIHVVKVIIKFNKLCTKLAQSRLSG